MENKPTQEIAEDNESCEHSGKEWWGKGKCPFCKGPTDLLLSREEVSALYECLKNDSFGHHYVGLVVRDVLIKMRKFLDN